jgi:hypothetical protein
MLNLPEFAPIYPSFKFHEHWVVAEYMIGCERSIVPMNSANDSVH